MFGDATEVHTGCDGPRRGEGVWEHLHVLAARFIDHFAEASRSSPDFDGAVVGFVTSGGYAHHSGVSVALGFLPVDMIEDGREVEIEILGAMRKARLITEALFDPMAERMRG